MGRELSREVRVRLSKRMSYFLRHHPEDAGLEPDAHGFVRLEGLAEAVGAKRSEVEEVAARDEKGRYEIAGEMIRATYGHSIPVEPPDEVCEPPEVLYHGTPRRSVQAILREGLRPMGRRMVHLSGSVPQAREVGRRRDSRPVVLIVDAKAAAEGGIRFWRAGEVYLCAGVPPEFIAILKE